MQSGCNKMWYCFCLYQSPLCDWIGYSLLCNSKMNVPPARERKEPEPLDEEDEEPVNLPGVQDDADNTGGGGGEAGGDFAAEAAKQKRMVGVGMKSHLNNFIQKYLSV